MTNDERLEKMTRHVTRLNVIQAEVTVVIVTAIIAVTIILVEWQRPR